MSMNNPAGAGGQPASGQQPGAPSQPPTQPQSQGPNDPLQPPAQGGASQPTPGAAGPDQGPQGGNVEDRLARMEAHMRRMGEERDQARRELEEERRKGLSPEERQRLATLDEQVKAQQQREKNLILRYEIASRAPRLGIIDPDVAVLLIEKSSKVTVADDGTVAGLDEALKDLIKERPHLVNRAAPGDIGAGAGAGGQNTGKKASMNDIIRGAARGRSIGGSGE